MKEILAKYCKNWYSKNGAVEDISLHNLAEGCRQAFFDNDQIQEFVRCCFKAEFFKRLSKVLSGEITPKVPVGELAEIWMKDDANYPRLYAVVKKGEHLSLGVGYDPIKGYWDQGYYDRNSSQIAEKLEKERAICILNVEEREILNTSCEISEDMENFYREEIAVESSNNPVEGRKPEEITQEEINEQVEIDIQQDKDYLFWLIEKHDKSHQQDTFVIKGQLGLWDGTHEIIPEEHSTLEDAVERCLDFSDGYVVVKINSIKGIVIEQHHHDGTNVLTIEHKDGSKVFLREVE